MIFFIRPTDANHDDPIGKKCGWSSDRERVHREVMGEELRATGVRSVGPIGEKCGCSSDRERVHREKGGASQSDIGARRAETR